MIDLHCHILPGVDDGPATIDDSIAVARAAAAAGTRTLVATSHVSFEYQTRADTIARLVNELNLRLREAKINIEVLAGAELAMTFVPEIAPEELGRLCLGGSRWLLVEPPFTSLVTGLDRIVADLTKSGYRAILAHPERCQAFQRDRESLERLVGSGVLVSVTAGSLVGRFGAPVRRFAYELVADGLAHNIASDAHGTAARPPSIRPELDRAGIAPSLAEWLTESVPRAILDDRDIPERPIVDVTRARRVRWPRRLRR